MIAARHLARNPDLLVPTSMEDIPDHGSAARVFPITKRPTFELLTEAGQFTSACAITPYEGGAFPEDAGPSLFVAEPVHNLVHRDVLAPAGSTFVARRSQESREFLAAGDSWFRPVFLYAGPDGALYVVDYYRARIEHPEWSASDVQKDPAPLYEGQDRGRIYRITRDGATLPRRPVALGSASDEALVADCRTRTCGGGARRSGCSSIERPAAWSPRSAPRPAGPSAVGRVHALWTLDGLGLLDVRARAPGARRPGTGRAGERHAARRGPPDRRARARRTAGRDGA